MFEESEIRRKARQGGAITILGDANYFSRRLGRTELSRDGMGLLRRGYEKYSKLGKPWAKWGPSDNLIVVVPPDVCDEVKNMPLQKLDFVRAVETTFKWSLHTNILGRGHVDAIRYKSNRLNELFDFMVEQRDKSFINALAKAEDNQWHIFTAFQLFWEIVIPIDTAVIMGAEFAANTTYIHHIGSYCKTIPSLSYFYFVMPGILRKSFWWFSPFGIMTRHHVRKLKSMLVPEVRARIEAARKDEGYRQQFVLVDALVSMKMENRIIKRDSLEVDAKEEAKQVNQCAEDLMFMTFGGAGPVTLLTVQLIFELIAHPEYLQPLRDQVAGALEISGGKWTEQAIANMPKLESFTRETLRLNNPAPFTVTREVVQPIPLKSGLILQPGMMITAPSHAIHTDPANYPNGTAFDGLRFYDAATNTTTTRATTTSNKFLAFGYGSQSCPGRYIGVKMAQLIFAKVLWEWDMEFWPKREGKPDNIVMPGQVLPDISAKIRMRRRVRE